MPDFQIGATSNAFESKQPRLYDPSDNRSTRRSEVARKRGGSGRMGAEVAFGGPQHQPATQSRFSRGQRVVLWATVSVILLAAMYPTTEVLTWKDNGWNLRIPPETLKILVAEHPWVNNVGSRKLVVTLDQWSDHFGGDEAYFKEFPDFRRMIVEILTSLVLGGGLAYAIGRRPV